MHGLPAFASNRPARRGRRSAAALALVLLATSLTACDVRRYVSGWAPYWAPTTSAESFSANADLFEDVSPFWYQAQGAPGTIVPNVSTASMSTLVEAARSRGVPVLPAITDGHGPGGLAAILADPAARALHVEAIVDLVMDNGYDGIDLDYEGFAFSDGRDTWPTTRPNWARFVEELGDALHRRNKLLAVTVPPIWNGGASGYTVYAWPEIGPHIDRLRIMNYDWSFSQPGPGSPIWWVEDTIEYAASVVPISKVQIGIPAYGREWTRSTTGTCPADQLPSTTSHTVARIPALLEATGGTPTRDPASGEMTFSYTRTIETHIGRTSRPRPRSTAGTADTIDRAARPLARAVRLRTCVITREVWYPDATAMAQRARAATDAGAGAVIWALSYETPTEWAALAAVGAELTGPTGTAPFGALERARVRSTRIRVVGWAADPEGDLPISVRVTVRDADAASGAPLTTTVLARGERTDVAADHPGAGEFHGFDVRVPMVRSGSPTGPYEVCVVAIGRYSGPATTSLGCRTVDAG
jgi:spore germination protein YaaH